MYYYSHTSILIRKGSRRKRSKNKTKYGVSVTNCNTVQLPGSQLPFSLIRDSQCGYDCVACFKSIGSKNLANVTVP